ncbi:AaceriAGR097Wp [[Ashbya] aceris (nom. inval.)]|nr:AaceriAGR097Wp [[Ashbya] aceris (nom. inval.)]
MLALVAWVAWLGLAQGFYLPGSAPTTYRRGDQIPLLVNHITPTVFHEPKEGAREQHDKERFLYAYDYYYPRLHMCQPDKIEKVSESLGSIIFGDRLHNSPFELKMLEEKSCVSLCETTVPGEDATFINQLIRSGFFHNWLVDGLPAGREMHDTRTNTDFYGTGFELGRVIRGTTEEEEPTEIELQARRVLQPGEKVVAVPYFMNHFQITVDYHKRGEDEFRVVGVSVLPLSLENPVADKCAESGNGLVLKENADNKVTFTYSVRFRESEVSWATRWGKYLHVYDPKVQWYSLINFSLVVLVLSSIMVHSLFRALKTDLDRYNDFNLDNEFQEDYGWKLLHGDVFRSPTKALLLSVFVGSGGQLFLMSACTLFIAMMGFLSPSSRGSLGTIMFVLYAIFGGFGSYLSMSTYKLFGGEKWKVNMILTPLLVPGIMFATMLLMNFFLIMVQSSGAMPFGTMLAIVVIWFVLSIPIAIMGSLIARKKNTWDQHPTKTNQIAKQIPPQPWYLKTWPAAYIAGLFPFGAIAVELYFIYSSIWFNTMFYMFGFLFFTFLLLTLTTALVTILLTYYSLCMENWSWQWRSFIIGGVGCSTYVFINSILFTKFRLGGFVTIVLYVGYSLLISFLFCLVTGTIGFLSSLWFVRKIYSSIKVD